MAVHRCCCRLLHVSNAVTLSRRPQPPALPHQRCGGDALPDGGCHHRHDVSESGAGRPRGAAVLPGDRGGTPPQPLSQPEHHWNFQRPVAVETLPDTLSQDAVRAHFSSHESCEWRSFAKERFVLFFFFLKSRYF